MGVQGTNIGEISKRDQHIIFIAAGEQWHFPKIDYSLWLKDLMAYQQFNIESLKEFLRSHYIIDDFGDNHEAREAWKIGSGGSYNDVYCYDDYYQRNALGFGILTFTVEYLMGEIRRGYLGKNIGELARLTEEVSTKINDGVGTNAKLIDYVRDVKQKVYTIFELLSKDSPNT